MRERPILFSAPMVRAILAGTKTQTRRIARLTSAGHVKEPAGHRRWHPADPEASLACPYGQPSDRLWVRETFISGEEPGSTVWYRASERDPVAAQLRWTPSIHMPRWASRITLEVTGTRVERLQEISEEDARAEGVTPFPHDPEGDCWTAQPQERKHRAAFEYLWGEINGWDGEPRGEGRSFVANPWVWVVSFRRLP